MSERIQQQADKITENYAKRQFKEAYERVERERHGKGCGCNTCLKLAVKDVNQWADFLTKGHSPAIYDTRVGKKGQLEIVVRANNDN